MHRFLSFYRQNRLKFWGVVLLIVFIFVVIRIFNSVAKSQNRQDNIEINNEAQNQTQAESYENQSDALISTQDVPEGSQEETSNIINEFFTYCINHEPDKAYEMLSSDIKENVYRSQKSFEDLYYNVTFNRDNLEYSFQAWIVTNETYTYQVKVYENLLASGKKDYEYTEDYVTLVPENGGYKLNINNYINGETVDKSASNDVLDINVTYVKTYMDYQEYTIYIKNKTDENIILDTRDDTKTAYITDDNNNNYYSYLYEKDTSDLIISPNENKRLEIKFNNTYRDGVVIKSMNFDDIVKQSEYENDNNTSNRYNLKIEF